MVKKKKNKSSTSISTWKDTQLEYIIRLLRTGHTESESSDILLQQNIAPHTILELLTKAKLSISRDFTKDKDYIVGQHVKRYDTDIQRLLHYTPRTLNPQKAVELKTNAYLRMIETMGQKEKLLGYHAKNFNIKINNETIVTVKEKKKKWNLEKLSLEEKIELLRLISKAKRSDSEVYGIVLQGEQAKTEEVFIKINSQKAIGSENINQINPIYVSQKTSNKEPITLLSAQDSLRLALIEQAKKAFKNAGSQDDTLNK